MKENILVFKLENILCLITSLILIVILAKAPQNDRIIEMNATKCEFLELNLTQFSQLVQMMKTMHIFYSNLLVPFV